MNTDLFIPPPFLKFERWREEGERERKGEREREGGREGEGGERKS